MANTQYQLADNAAEIYEKYAVPVGPLPSGTAMLDHLSFTRSDRVLDAACGTGIVVRLFDDKKRDVSHISCR